MPGVDGQCAKITSISVQRDGDWILLDVTANAFLQHMVRNITGTLVAVGSGEEDIRGRRRCWKRGIARGEELPLRRTA